MIPEICGASWDRADADAAALRARAIAMVMRAPGRLTGTDHSNVPARIRHDEPIRRDMRTMLHEDPSTGATVHATIEPAILPDRGLVHFRLSGHPHVKDMRLVIQHDHRFAPSPDLTAQADLAATILERYAADMASDGLGCRSAIIRSAQAVGSSLARQCRSAWKDGKSQNPILNVFCRTPWTRTLAWSNDPSGRDGRLVFLTRDAMAVLDAALPTAMAVDWIDEIQKGTGIRTTVLRLGPLTTVNLVSTQIQEDPMAELHARSLLPLPERGILGR